MKKEAKKKTITPKTIKKDPPVPGYQPPVIIIKNHYSLKYTPEYAEQLLGHLKSGYSFNSYRPFEPLQSVAPSTLKQWLHDFPDFARARDEGEAFFQRILEQGATVKATGNIPKGKEEQMERSDLSAIKFLLERRCAETYKQKVDNIIQNPDGSKIETTPVNVNFSNLSEKELDAMIKLHEKAAGQ